MEIMVWIKARPRGDDVIFFVCRWYLPRWCPGSMKYLGNLSSSVNSMEAEINKKCEEIEDLLYALEIAKTHHKGEFKEINDHQINRNGDTDWYQEELKYIKTLTKHVPKQEAFYKKVLNTAFMRRYGHSSEEKKDKKSSYDDIPNNLANAGERSLYFLKGTTTGAKNAMVSDSGADNGLDFKPPEKGKKKGKGKGKDAGHWKNRRKNESEDEYDDRMLEGEPS